MICIEPLLRLLTELFPDADIEGHTALIDDKVIKSTDIFFLVAEIEGELGVKIPAHEIVRENFNSYEALLGLVRRLGG